MSNNPLIDDAIAPGVSITLPTLGAFYDPGVLSPDVNVHEAGIRPYGVWQELTWRDPYAIMSGDAFVQFLNVASPWVEKPLEICQIDAEIIMMASRIASYGPMLKVPVKCTNPAMMDDLTSMDGTGQYKQVPVCQVETKCEIDLHTVLGRYNPIHNYEEWSIKLKSGQVVNLRPAIHLDMVNTFKYQFELLKMTKSLEQKAIKNDGDISTDEFMQFRDQGLMIAQGARLKQYLSQIRSVTMTNGKVVNDRKMIEGWLRVVPSSEVRRIDDHMNYLVQPLTNLMQVDYICPNCNHDMGKVSVMDDPTAFFGPGSAN